jgi:hypothetical protein
MKILSILVGILLIALTVTIASEPRTKEEFMKAVRIALEQKNTNKLEALTYSVGMSDTDKMDAAEARATVFEDYAIDSIALGPIPEHYQSIYIHLGKKLEPTYAPAGLMEIKYKNTAGVTSTTLPYAIVEGRYFLVSMKSTDLKWTGAPDKNISFMVMGEGQDEVKIKARWNASGVVQQQDFDAPSSSFWGQYFESITVTSTNEATDVKIHIMESGKEIFVSEPLKGKGTLEYKKKN